MRDNSEGEPRSARRTQKRPPKKVTERYLTNVARWYIERYAPCSGQLRRALMKRVRRGLAEHGGDREEALLWVEAVIAKMIANGSIDDEEYARSWVRRYHRRGVARRDIAYRLRGKGLPREAIELGMTELDEDGDPALQAICSYARRRRFGPFRLDPDKRAARREKDLAAMARAGHRYDLAKRVLACEDLDAFFALEEEAGGR